MRTSFITFVFLTSGLELLASSALHAAELGEITVQESSSHESEKAPSNFTTVIKPHTQTNENKTLTEIVSESAGVQSKDLGGPGQYSTVTIRGSTAEQVTVLLDGVKINTAQGGGVDFSSIPVDSIERIEIIRGGGTAAFGGDAIGGVINILTKKAKEGRIIEIKETGGSFTTFKSSESWAERRKKWGIVFSHTHSQSDGDYKFKSASTNLAGTSVGGGVVFKRLHNGFISEDFLAKFDIAARENLKFEFLNNFFLNDRDIPGLEEETTQAYPSNLLEAHERIFRNVTTLSSKISGIADNHLLIEGGMTNNFNTDDFEDPSPAIGTAIDKKTTNESLNPYLLFQPSFENSIAAHFVTLRYDYKYDYFKDGSDILGASLTGKKSRHTSGIFFQDETSFMQGKISLIPAVRYEDTNTFPDDFSMKAGIALKPFNWLVFKGNMENSFRYPNFNELYFPDQGYIRGNTGLQKEEALNYDAGFSVKANSGEKELFFFEASYFRNDIKNQIIWVPISATTIEPVNTYNVEAEGLETTANVNPFDFLGLSANYTWLKAHFKSNRLQLPGRPAHKVNARMDLSKNFNRWFGGGLFGEMRYSSSIPVNTQNTVFISSRAIFNAGATAKFPTAQKNWGNFALTFEAKDITNVQIYDARGFPLPRRAFYLTLGGKWS
jgi:iron complex outermembrane receptor protein